MILIIILVLLDMSTIKIGAKAQYNPIGIP